MSTHNICFYVEPILMSTHNMCCYGELILMSTHNMCCYGELTKIILRLPSNALLICFTVIEPTHDEPPHEKTCLCHMRTTKHPRSLISSFIVPCLDSIISLLAIAEILRP